MIIYNIIQINEQRKPPLNGKIQCTGVLISVHLTVWVSIYTNVNSVYTTI